jgi:hypothetical protein
VRVLCGLVGAVVVESKRSPTWRPILSEMATRSSIGH